MKRQKDMTMNDKLPRSADAQYGTEEEWGNNSKKHEEMEQSKHNTPCGCDW